MDDPAREDRPRMPLAFDIAPEAVTIRADRRGLHVRPIAPTDRNAWAPLWRGYLAFYETELAAHQYDLTWSRLNDPEDPLFGYLAEDETGAKGLVHIVFHRSAWTRGPSTYLQDLFAAPEARGKGVGRALIEHVYDVARAAGSPRVHWLTHETNATAMKLYDRIAERSGFVQYRKGV